MCACTPGFVVYPGSFFVLWISMNQSFQSPPPEVSIVSLLHNSATEQLTVFVQNFKSFYMSACRWHVRIFLTNMSTWKKDRWHVRIFFTDMSTWKNISKTALPPGFWYISNNFVNIAYQLQKNVKLLNIFIFQLHLMVEFDTRQNILLCKWYVNEPIVSKVLM